MIGGAQRTSLAVNVNGSHVLRGCGGIEEPGKIHCQL